MSYPNRAFSLRQPWAGLIALGIKDIENRGVRTSVRGPVLLHAAKLIDETAMRRIEAGLHPVTNQPTLRLSLNDLHICKLKGGIMGIFSITDSVSGDPSPWFTGPWGYKVADARVLPFMGFRGMQGFFPAEYVAP